MAIEPNGAPAAPLSVEQLQAEIASAREDLLSSVTALKGQLTSEALRERAAENVKGWFVDEFGTPRVNHIVIVGGVVAGAIVLRALLKR